VAARGRTSAHGTLHLRQPRLIDSYNLDPGSLAENSTSVLRAFFGSGHVVVVPLQTLTVESWLPEVAPQLDETEDPALPESNMVARQIAELQETTGLTDAELAAAFPRPVYRETVNRWRNRGESNMKPANAYRLGLLADLVETMKAAGIEARTWLRQPVRGELQTPYDLICVGRLGDVRQAVEAVLAGAAPAWERMQIVEVPPDSIAAVEEEDEGSWTWEAADDGQDN
jgi:hypothetical protein